jgi:hypothetical protein
MLPTTSPASRGASTATALLAGDPTLDGLPASRRLSAGKEAAITAVWPQVLTCRSMIRMRGPVPANPAGWRGHRPAAIPAEVVIARLGLWRRTRPRA